MIVITGGAGFIGSHLVAALEERNDGALVIVDRFGTGDKWRNVAKRELLAVIPPDGLFDFLVANRTWIDLVFHMGAISSTAEPDVDLTLNTNFTLSQSLWRWCAENRVRFIYASSAATYGNGSEGFEDEATSNALARLRPLNAYGWSKHLFDRWVVRQVERGYARPPQWAGFKFFNVYGANEYHKGSMRSVALQLFEQVSAGKPAVLFASANPDFPDGGQLRDFVAVEDCVADMLWVADHPQVSGIFNSGSGTARSFTDLANAMFAVIGRDPDIRFVPTPESLRENYQYFTEARMGRLTAHGYDRRPIPLEAGIARYVHDFLTQPDRYR